ncbi:hypothetical protein ACT3UM_22785 [Halomonas sp. AOP13-D3-9]
MTSSVEPPDRLTIVLDRDAQRLVKRFREAYYKALETPEDKRGSKNGYKKRVADEAAAAKDLALWIDVITQQAEQAKS